MSEEHMWEMKQKNALRDYFAAQAMNAYLKEEDAPIYFLMISKRAYQMADAMMKAREI